MIQKEQKKACQLVKQLSEANPQYRFMEHQLARKSAVVEWGDLPPELLELISNKLPKPTDIFQFRWVCRCWRLSTPPPPDKLSPFFPRLLSWSLFEPRTLNIHAAATYLIRSRHENNQSWMVSLEESVPGKLVPRHVITYMKIGDVLGLSPDDWIVSQLARSYAQHKICPECNVIKNTKKVVIAVANNRASSLVGLCSVQESLLGMCAFELGSNKWGEEARAIHLDCINCPRIVDFVKLKGWIYAVDFKGSVYVVDRDNSRLHLVCSHDFSRYEACRYNGGDDPDNPYNIGLIVSNDTIYVVLCLQAKLGIFRLVSLVSNENGMMTSSKWKRVRDLGDRVFFFTKNCSFSISAADLPPPWQGNCVVRLNDTYTTICGCNGDEAKDRVSVYFVGGQSKSRYRETLCMLEDGYSALFALPSSWISSTHNQSNKGSKGKTA